MIEKVATFKGKKLSSMSKGELIEAVELLSCHIETNRLMREHQLEVLGNFREQRNKGFFHRIFRLIFG